MSYRPRRPRIKISLEEVDILPFDDRTVVNRFSSGRRPIDQFLKNKAKKAVRRREFQIFCAYLPASFNVIGYYALQLGSDSVRELPANPSNYVANYVAFPAVHLSYLGVHEDYQANGLGKHMLMDAFTNVCKIADYAGFYALTLQSLDAESTSFYSELGFTPYSQGLESPKMLYPIQTLIALVRES